MRQSPNTARRFVSIPVMPGAHANLGTTFSDQKKPDDAIAAFREAIRLEPNDFENHFSLGCRSEITGKIG